MTARLVARREVDAPAISGHQAALDGVRAVAALAVVLFHVAASTGYLTGNGALPWLLSRGEIGVPIFFTLSGLLLFRPWAAAALGVRAASPRTGSYLWKRALRLLPAYWVLVLVTMLLYARDHLGDVWTWVKLLTLTYSYDPKPWWGNNLGPKGLGQIWSLTVEAAFYVTLPLIGAILVKCARSFRGLLYGLAVYAAISPIYTLVISHWGNRELLGVWLPRYCGWFAVGMALAVLSVQARVEAESAGSPEDGPVLRFCRTVSASWGMCWLTAALLYCVASTPLTGVSREYVGNTWTAEFQVVLYGLVAAFFVAPVALAPASHPAIGAVLGNRVMSYLGRISYSIFLWQFVVIYEWFSLTNHPPFTGNLLVDFPVCAVLTVALAAVSYALVEKPARRLGLRRSGGRAPDRAPG